MMLDYLNFVLSPSTIFLLITLVTLYYIYVLKASYWESRGVPCDKPLPFFGNFKGVFLRKCNFWQLISENYKKFEGPYFGLSLLNKNILVLKDPELIKNVLVKDFTLFDNRDFASNEKVDPIAYNMLISAPNPKWKALRAKVSPIFSSGKMKLMFNLMKECGEEMVDFITRNQGKVLEMKEVCSKFTTDVISSCAFGINANSFKSSNPEFYTHGRRIFGDGVKNTFSQFCYFFLPSFVHFFKLKFIDGKATNFLSKAFWNTFENRKLSKIQRNDLIDILNKIQKESVGSELIFDEMVTVAQAIVFFFAGQETTSSLISFVLSDLLAEPDVLKRLREEINEKIEKHDGLTYDCINDMPYLDTVVQEGLRKYPLIIFLSRISSQKYTFQKTGLTIEKGTSILIPYCGLHYDEKYFSNPEKFDPERFSPENKGKVVPYTYLPFGDGPRNCIGARFGTINTKVGIISIVKNFDLVRCPETQIPLKFSQKSNLLQSEKGIFMSLKKIE